jgi:citrate lyase alpha subunit
VIYILFLRDMYFQLFNHDLVRSMVLDEEALLIVVSKYSNSDLSGVAIRHLGMIMFVARVVNVDFFVICLLPET